MPTLMKHISILHMHVVLGHGKVLLYLCPSLEINIIGSYGGGQLLSIDGAGFDETVKVTVCGEVCVTDMDASTSSVIKCLSPSAGLIFILD